MRDFKKALRLRQAQVESALAKTVPRALPLKLHQAMRYSLMAGGKRLRPLLVLAAGEACGAKPGPLMKAACALECLHTYSLIHDDLPAMDDDDLRRGKPTNHKKFGEATAILAGDGLLTLSFELMAASGKAGLAAEAARVLALAAGSLGMVGGQSADIEAEGKRISAAQLRFIHAGKTGALITAAIECGAVLAGAPAPKRRALVKFGKHIGLAFQMADDILNVIGNAKKMGKKTGSDAGRGKATYPALFGLERSKAMAQAEWKAAQASLKIFKGKAWMLEGLARFVIERDH
jgi:geranylgeranyl diphosphate synthase type II